MIQATLIFNPASGRGKRKEALLPSLWERLKRQGITVEPAPTRSPHDATDLARQAVEGDTELVLVWGGDGTLNEVARGMLGSAVPVGLLPGGTVNVFARATGIPSRIDEACELLSRGQRRWIPVGMAAGRPFLLMAGVGLDADVVHRLDPDFKRKLGVMAFWMAGFRRLATYPFPPFTVRARGREYQATSLIAGKTPLYGSGYVITPEARVNEPFLDVVLFQGRRGASYLRYLVGVVGGFHTRFRDVVHFQTPRLEIQSAEPIQYQVDGEAAGQVPVTLEVRPAALKVVLPRPRHGPPHRCRETT